MPYVLRQPVRADGGSAASFLCACKGMLASNDQAKELLEPTFGKGWATTLGASAISGFFAVTFSLPFDFIKTRSVEEQRSIFLLTAGVFFS